MMDFQYGWLLNLIVYLPLAGALLMMLFINKENSKALKTWATLVAGIDFVISIPLWFLYKTDGAEFQFATVKEWIPSVGVQYLFGVDGFAVLREFQGPGPYPAPEVRYQIHGGLDDGEHDGHDDH